MIDLSANLMYNITNSGKAILALGDSYTSGAGAIDDEIYENYKWRHQAAGYPLQFDISDDEKRNLVKQYPLLRYENGTINTDAMTQKNAFVNVLCETYFANEYTPINFGLSGSGNRGRVRELYLNPQIPWDAINDLIVIYCPTGIERFDFIDDQWFPSLHTKTMWPTTPPEWPSTPRTNLWRAYGDAVYSEKAAIIEQIAIVQELQTWCKLRKAKLIITPAFDPRYDRDLFEDALSTSVTRNDDWSINTYRRDEKNPSNAVELLDLWPWDSMFKPEGFENFAQLSMSKDDIKDKNDFYFQFQGTRSPNGWMTPCSHPGQKAHDLFAKLLYQHITK